MTLRNHRTSAVGCDHLHELSHLKMHVNLYVLNLTSDNGLPVHVLFILYKQKRKNLP